MAKKKKKKKAVKASTVHLSPRLREVVRLASLGCTLHDIGAILGISPNTVDNHRTRAMKLLGVDRMALLTRAAILTKVSSLSDKLTPTEKRKLNASRKKRKRKR